MRNIAEPNTFIKIENWMRELQFKGRVERDVYACINGFHSGKYGICNASIDYIADMVEAGRVWVINSLKDLVEKKYIIKKDMGNSKPAHYTINVPLAEAAREARMEKWKTWKATAEGRAEEVEPEEAAEKSDMNEQYTEVKQENPLIHTVRNQLSKLGYSVTYAETIIKIIQSEWLQGNYTVLDHIADYIAKQYSEKPHAEQERIFTSVIKNTTKWNDLLQKYKRWREGEQDKGVHGTSEKPERTAGDKPISIPKPVNRIETQERTIAPQQTPTQSAEQKQNSIQTQENLPTICPLCGAPINTIWKTCTKGCGSYKIGTGTGEIVFVRHGDESNPLIRNKLQQCRATAEPEMNMKHSIPDRTPAKEEQEPPIKTRGTPETVLEEAEQRVTRSEAETAQKIMEIEKKSPEMALFLKGLQKKITA